MIIKVQLVREQSKFNAKFKTLVTECENTELGKNKIIFNQPCVQQKNRNILEKKKLLYLLVLK